MTRTPILFKYPNYPVDLEDFYKGAECFLVCGGPSLNSINLQLLNQSGCLVASLNNAGALVRPHISFTVDHPKSFHQNLWFDPQVIKFVPDENIEKSFLVYDHRNKLVPSNRFIYTLPTVLTYRRNKAFNAETFLEEPTINWGCESHIKDSEGNKGGRSVMYPAFRILYYLGIRRLFLLGCDFKMDFKQPYAFPQKKHEGGCNTNNQAYVIHNNRFTTLRPFLERKGLKIYNCYKESALTAFEYMSYEKAIDIATCQFQKNPKLEGMYGNEE